MLRYHALQPVTPWALSSTFPSPVLPTDILHHDAGNTPYAAVESSAIAIHALDCSGVFATRLCKRGRDGGGRGDAGG